MEKSQANPPWWESRLPVLQRELRRYLDLMIRSSWIDRDELVNQTLSDLSHRILTGPSGVPSSWFGSAPPEQRDDQAYLFRLARTILKRRIVDLFRRRAKEWTNTVRDEDLLVAIPSPAVGTERQMLATQMLRICVAALADMSEEDRELFAYLTGMSGSASRSFSDAERKRLQRMRRRLKDDLVRQLGPEAAEFFRDDLED